MHNPHYRYVIASLDQEPRDLDTELSELEEAADAEEITR
jgi:ATP-binding cassette subfamily B protein